MNSDWKEEYLPRLQRSQIYKTLNDKCGDKDKEIIVLVEEVVSYAYQRTKTIIKHMGEFTLHDSDHLFRVLYIMEKLLTKDNVSNLSSPELMLLILSAFLHDIGMAPDEKEVQSWKKVWDKSPTFEDKYEKEKYNNFKRFCDARPDKLKIIEQFIEQGKNSHVDTLKGYLISEYIRLTHADRARNIIHKDFSQKIKFREADLTVELAQICDSHNNDALNLLDLEKDFLCGEDQIACLPLIGVILRLADILDFDGKRTPSVLFSHLFIRNPISIVEWEKHRAIEAWEINQDFIQYSAKCRHPAIEASIHDFCDLIDQELLVCNNIISEINEFNQERRNNITVKIPKKINRDKIKTKRNILNEPIYQYRKTQFNLSKKEIVDLLMGTKLYGNPEVAIRELLQNSIDACLLRSAQEKKWGNPYNPQITVKYYTENDEDVLEVIDNGTGMDQYIIDNYYSRIGSSFYKSTDFFEIKSESKAEFTPTSRFGIGILSCFMVSDKLIVNTRRVYGPHESSDPIEIIIEGEESIFWTRKGKMDKPGTSTKLLLREAKNPWERMDEEEFIKSVESVIPNPPFQINIETKKKKKTRDQKSFKEIKVDTLKNYSWDDVENINMINVSLENQGTGILGSAIVAILQQNNQPVRHVKLTKKEIEIEGEFFTLEKKLSINNNSINKSSKSITIDEEGIINEEDSFSKIAHSQSRISLHGIEIPTTLFPSSWNTKKNKAKIEWPLPLLIVVDVCGNRDLDLNSARTEINKTDKWIDFEEELAFLICNGIKNSIPEDYWNKLIKVLRTSTKNKCFLNGLEKSVKQKNNYP